MASARSAMSATLRDPRRGSRRPYNNTAIATPATAATSHVSMEGKLIPGKEAGPARAGQARHHRLAIRCEYASLLASS